MTGEYFEADVQTDETGNQFIVFPDDLTERMGWEVGDEIQWIDNNDGSWTMKKVEKTEYVLVECLQSYRTRYVVEVPVGKKDWADDTVVMQKAKEFSQLDMGEIIISSRVINSIDIMLMCDEDNDYVKSWNDEHKIKTFVTKWEDIKDV